MKKLLAAAAVSALAMTAAQPAFAQARGVVGTLTCTGGEGVGFIIGSQKRFACRFVPTSGKAERYTATVNRFGLDVGVTGRSTMVWTVLGSASKKRALAGSYGGASADASLGIGGGAKVLVGGSNQSVVLQPVSVQGQTGVNVAVGVTSLTLR